MPNISRLPSESLFLFNRLFCHLNIFFSFTSALFFFSFLQLLLSFQFILFFSSSSSFILFKWPVFSYFPTVRASDSLTNYAQLISVSQPYIFLFYTFIFSSHFYFCFLSSYFAFSLLILFSFNSFSLLIFIFILSFLIFLFLYLFSFILYENHVGIWSWRYNVINVT